MADWSYTITHYYSGGTQNISSDIISIPLFTDTGSGEVNEAQIVLNAIGGQYISANINSKTIISQYDSKHFNVSYNDSPFFVEELILFNDNTSPPIFFTAT